MARLKRKLFVWLFFPILLSVILGGGVLAFANAPNPPVLTVGTVTDTTIDLSWTETASNHGHTLFRCDTNPGCDPDEIVANQASSPFQDTGLEPNKLYRYKVVESHGPNSADSNIVEATTADTGAGGGLCQGNTGNQGSPPKVDIFAREVTNNAILVTWENPNDGQDCIKFAYTVFKDVNDSGNFVPIFSSIREVEEKIVENGRQVFFFLDEDIQPNNFYTYSVSAGNSQGNPNPNLSDDTKKIFIDDFVEFTHVESRGYLIIGRTITPISPIIQIISWFDWLNPFQLVQAEQFTNPIFTTTLNPQIESYRLALEPVPNPIVTGECTQSLEFEYTKNDVKGQDFEMVVSIFETEFQTDDDTGVEVTQEVKLLRHQKVFQNFTDSTKLRQKWHVIDQDKQLIHDFSQLEVQFDITGKSGDPRSVSMWEVLFLVPVGNKAC